MMLIKAQSLSGRFIYRLALGLALLFIMMALPACQPSIELMSPELMPPAVPLPGVATVAPVAHSISLIGVDFDPPLDYAQIISNGGVTLLVAIENSGWSTEGTVLVSARLLDPAESQTGAELLNETVAAKSLAPGEVRVVRFSQVSELPVRERYKLVVEVATAPGEPALTDNFRTFDIFVYDAR